MMVDWKNSVNQINANQKINDITEYITINDTRNKYISPIDEFYKSLKEVLDIVQNPDVLEQNKSLGTLLLIGIVSNTENYFREIMSQIIRICPISQAASSSQSINLGSVIWHLGNNIEIGSFENISFADSKSIRKTCKTYLSYDISKNAATSAVLDEFDKICELRHGIVHSNKIIAGKNAIKLGIKPNKKSLRIYIGYKQLQECAIICTSLVCSFNLELFEEIVKRWAIDWCKLPSWDENDDNKVFNTIWKTFFSEIDSKRNSISANLSAMKCRNIVKKVFSKS